MKKFLDCISVVGTTPSRFQGTKKYVSTGAVATTEIDESEVVEVTYEDRPSRANLSAEAGDILFAKMQGTRKTLLLDSETEEHIYSTGFYAVRANPEVITTECLYYLVDSELFLTQKDKHCSGATQKAITNGGLAKIEIRVPPLSEQGVLTEKLRYLTQLIADKRKQLELFDEVIKSRFIEMFGDVKNNDRNWPMATMGDVAEIKIGPFGTLLHKEDYIVGGHALVNPSHIVDGKISVDISLTISDEKYEELSAYHLKIDDIVLGRRGEMGRCAVVKEEGLLCGTGSLIIRPNDRLKPYFLQTIISNPTYKKIIEDKAVGVTMMNLNVPIVESLRVPMLPIELQNDFISFMKQVDKSKFEIQKSLEKLETLKKALMQKYFW